LGYAPVSKTIQKSQEIYQKVKGSNSVFGYSMNKVESSVRGILESPIGKFVEEKVDSTMSLIDRKLNVDEKGCKVLDLVEKKKEQVGEFYQWGRYMVDAQKENLIEKGQEAFEDKKKKIKVLYTTSKKGLDEKKEVLEKQCIEGKDKALSIFSQTKGNYIDKPQKFIVDLLQSKYVTLKGKFPDPMKKVDEFYEASKVVADIPKEKVAELYAITCKYYNNQKEAVKLKSLKFYYLGATYIKQGQEYLHQLTDNENENKESKENTIIVNTDHEITRIGVRYISLASQYLDILKSKLPITINESQ